MVGNLRRLDRRRPAAKREGEERDRGVARARNVEDLPRLGRDVMRRGLSLKSIMPCSPNVISKQLVSQDARTSRARREKGASSFASGIDRIGRRQTRRVKGFRSVGFDRRAPDRQSIVRCGFGSAVDDLARALGISTNLCDKFRTEKSLAVILENDRVDFRGTTCRTSAVIVAI